MAILIYVTEAVKTSASYKESLAWLFGTQLFGIKLGLDNIRLLLATLQLPPDNQRIVHVAGTNGKGSVCAMIDAISRTQGYRTGLFTSPHLVSFRERIRVNGEMIGESAVATGLTEIRKLIAAWDPHPTFFEIATALALQHFARMKCEVVVLETGMGGRLDATNAIKPVISVVTPIGLDHQKWLGETLAEIAAEKAGIIKPRVPVVSARQLPAAESVLRAKALECEAPLQFIDTSWNNRIPHLPGSYQEENAALAIAAVRASGTLIDEKAITQGLENVTWPARFQRYDKQLVIDGAHNPAGARILSRTWREIFGKARAVIILATLRDKDAVGIVAALAPIAARFLLPHAETERALPPAKLAHVVSTGAPHLAVRSLPSLAAALADARDGVLPILITGSLHFAGEALALLEGEPEQFEDCLQ